MQEISQRPLAGKAALVSGGGVGIGRAIALGLAEAGADIAVTWLSHGADGANLVDEIKKMGRAVFGLSLDATNKGEVDRVVGQAMNALGRLDICVNNAGGLIGRSQISETPDDHWAAVMDVNVTSAFYVTRSVLDHLSDGGRIINMSSMAAYNGGGPGCVPYVTAKAALCGFTRGLAKELAARRITVNAVAPGFVADTPYHSQFTPPEAQRTIMAAIPLGRPGQPSDVASAVTWLCSPGAEWISGEVLQINGGHYFS